jgi:ketol-acid reductoisomerase
MKQMLSRFQNGTYAKAWIAENEAGRPNFPQAARRRSPSPH